MPESLEHALRRALNDLERSDLRRALRDPTGVDLCSNDYLGLARHPELVRRMGTALATEGVGSTGSRLLRGERQAFSLVERRFAGFKRAERALYFSSGYLANLGVLSTLAQPGDVIFSDERNHASLIDGIRLSKAKTVIFPHNDAERLATLVAATPVAQRGFLVTESLFSMDGDAAPLPRYVGLCRDAGLTLIVDEAHAVGVCGARGSGLLEDIDTEDVALVCVSTAGKALGVSGAFVTGPEWAIDYLVQKARPFIFSTAPPPALAAALEASLDLVEREPERRRQLADRVSWLSDALERAGLTISRPASHILPVVLGGNARALRVASELQAQGFDVRAIRPPTVPQGTARLRLSVNVVLSRADIDRFAASLAGAMETTLSQ